MAAYHDRKVLVTGATGFIGGYLIDKLLELGIRVIASGRSHKDNVHFSWVEKVTYIQANIYEEEKDWFTFFGRPDVLIHLSWEGLPNYKRLFHVERNLPVNYYFIKNLVKNGLKSVVVIGTCAEYGLQCGELREENETRPNTNYALAKDCLRKFLEQLQEIEGFDFKWIRVFYPYGKGQNPNSLLSQLEAALERRDSVFNMSSGEQLRDYLPVDAVAEYIAKIALQTEISSIINCCSGEPISVRQLVEEHLVRVNKHIDLNLGYFHQLDYEPIAFWGSTEKLQLALSASLECKESNVH